MTTNFFQDQCKSIKLPVPYNMFNCGIIQQPNASPIFSNPVSLYKPPEETTLKEQNLILPSENANYSETKLCSKRGRKELDKQLVDEKKAIRAERNRIFAKESRDRKRLYIQNLEQEIVFLRSELSQCRKKLSKYEFIEKHNRAEFEYLESINALSFNEKLIGSEKDFLDSIKAFYAKMSRERQLALGRMTQLMLEMFMPFTAKLVLCTMENGVNIHDTTDMVNFIHNKIPLIQPESLLDYLKSLYNDETTKNKFIDYIAESGKKIKNFVKEIIQTQKKVQIEISNISNFMIENSINKLSLKSLKAYMELTPQILSIPELSTYTMYNLNDADFTFHEQASSNYSK